MFNVKWQESISVALEKKLPSFRHCDLLMESCDSYKTDVWQHKPSFHLLVSDK